MEKLLVVLLDVMILLFSLLMMIFSIKVYQNYSINQDILNSYLENWNKGPLIDIISITNSEKCPNEYENLLSGDFPKIESGCNCLNSREFNNKIYSFNCTKEHIFKGCQMIIGSNSSSNYTSWRDHKLCAKRMKTNFWNISFVDSNSNCPILGSKKCGLLDSFNNVICIPQNEVCPISSFDILPSNKVPKYIPTKSISLGNGYNLYISNNNRSSQVLTTLVPSVDICISPDEGILGNNFYPLNSRKGKSICSTKIINTTVDTRYSLVDSYLALDFLKHNDLLKLVQRLPNYPIPNKNDAIGLYKFGYYGWNRKCFNDISIQNNSKFEDYNRKGLFLEIVCIIHFIFALASILVYKFLVGQFHITIKSSIIIDIINLLFLFTIFFYSANLLSKTRELMNPFKHLYKLKCGDDYTNAVFFKHFKSIIIAENFIVPNIPLTLIAILSIIAYYIYFFCNNRDYIPIKTN